MDGKGLLPRGSRPFQNSLHHRHPSPNITGQLHLGHALDNTIIDALIRFKRMQGYSALYLPGCDHASIATEVKIVEEMKKEGLTKTTWGAKDSYSAPGRGRKSTAAASSNR